MTTVSDERHEAEDKQTAENGAAAASDNHAACVGYLLFREKVLRQLAEQLGCGSIRRYPEWRLRGRGDCHEGDTQTVVI